MKTVGIRELKAKLSEYLHSVREGETLAVTDRGKAIARLSPSHDYPDLSAYDGSSAVRDPGIGMVTPPPHAAKKPKPRSYAALLKEAQKAGGHRTARETETKALEEYLRYKEQLSIIDLAGTIDYDPDYDYKAARRKR